MRHPRIVVVAIGVAIMALATLGGTWLQAERGIPNFPFQAKQAPGDEGFVAPTLTAEQIALAEEILASDARAVALLGGSSYTYKPMPVIDSDSGSEGLVGVGMLITFEPPISIEGTWLKKDILAPGDPRGLEPQVILEYMPDCVAPNGIVQAIALVDFRPGKLVQLEPLPSVGFDISFTNCPEGRPSEHSS